MARQKSRTAVVKSLFFLAAPIVLMLALVLWPREDPLNRAAVDGLSKLLKDDPDRAVRGISARSLGKIGHPRAAAVLLTAANDDELILPEIIQALRDLGVTPAELKVEYQERRQERRQEEPRSRPQRIAEETVYPLQEELLKIPVWWVMIFLFGAVAVLVLLVSFVQLLLDFWRTRRWRGLGVFLRAKIFPAALILFAAFTAYVVIRNVPPPQAQPDIALEEMAIIELARETRDAAMVEWLIEILRDADRSLALRWRAAEALGAIGEKSALAALISTLGAKEPRLRLSVAWAIGNILAKREEVRDEKLELRGLDERYAEELTRLLETKPDSGALYLLRGRVYSSMSRYMEAIRDFDRALALRPECGLMAEVHADRGFAFALANRVGDALEDYKSAIDLDCDPPSPGLEAAHFRRGLIRSARREWEGAVFDFSKALKINASNGEALQYRGYAYEKLGRGREAVADFAAYLKIEPHSLDRKKIEEKIESLESAAESASEPRSSMENGDAEESADTYSDEEPIQ
jgi:tetratricopeptide (TPR) repeat protein